MEKIAIFVSGTGKNAAGITKFFSEGNRLHTDCLVTDRDGSPAIAELSALGVETLYYPHDVWIADPASIANDLRKRGIGLIVVDDFDMEIPLPIVNEFSGNILQASASPENPMHVTISLLRFNPVTSEVTGQPVLEQNFTPESPESAMSVFWSRAIVQALSHEEHEITPPPYVSDMPPTPDQEWAETLRIKLPDEPSGQSRQQDPGIQNPPQMPEDISEMQPNLNVLNEPDPQQPQFRQSSQPATGQPFIPQDRVQAQDQRPPMPGTYMAWSLIALLLCCFIPAIVAIIYSAKVSPLYFSGRYAEAEKASERAQIWIIVSIVLGIISATFSIPLSLLQ